MKKAFGFLVLVLVVITVLPFGAKAAALSERLSGRILLQVEAHGEAWYVNPVDQKRYFLGRADDAYRLMRELGLGISESDYNANKNYAKNNLLGRIVLRVHSRGQAYYVNPLNRKFVSLGRPDDAFKFMRELGLGISNQDLSRIPADPDHNAKDYYKNEIIVSGSGATPSKISVPAGSNLDLRISVRDYNLSRNGIYFRGSSGMAEIATIEQGQARDLSITVNTTFTYTPFLANTNIRLPYEITIEAR